MDPRNFGSEKIVRTDLLMFFGYLRCRCRLELHDFIFYLSKLYILDWLNLYTVLSYWSKFNRWVHAENLLQYLETCVLIAEADRVLPHLQMTLTATGCTKWNTASREKYFVIHGWFVYWIFVKKCAACEKSDFGEHRFQKWAYSLHLAWKVSSNSGLIWCLSGPTSRPVSLSNYCIWCLFYEVVRSLCG